MGDRLGDDDLEIIEDRFVPVDPAGLLAGTDLVVVLPGSWLSRASQLRCGLERSAGRSPRRRYLVTLEDEAGDVAFSGSPAVPGAGRAGQPRFAPAPGLEVAWTPPRTRAWVLVAPDGERGATAVFATAEGRGVTAFRELLGTLQVVTDEHALDDRPDRR